ncbi:MAG: hypothetical protein K8R69_12630 [Deltaproteobacteria bacterium]|nr:hypothetical protein [Deltaproteobacteria bacterium]
MKPALMRSVSKGLFLCGLTALFACGGAVEQKAETPPQVCPTCPVCDATPSPTPEDLAEKLKGILEKNVKKFRTNPEAFQAASNQFGIAAKIGSKEIIAEDFPRFVSFFWAVDSEFRIQQLRAMMSTNRLIDMLKPATGKFDIAVAPKDLEAEDASLLISQVIVDWAEVQRTLEDDFMGLGVENVMGVKPMDDLPGVENMMKDLLAIVAPPQPVPTPTATPGLKTSSLRLLSWLEGSASAQTQGGIKGKAGAGLPVHSKAVPRVKIKDAPLLLGRVLTFNVGGKLLVSQSPLMAAIPEFQAIPVEQFQFKLEKQSVGPAYHDVVEQKVNALAAIPKRNMQDWWELSHGLTELRLLKQLVDYSKIEAAPAESAPMQPTINSSGNTSGSILPKVDAGTSTTSGSSAPGQRPSNSPDQRSEAGSVPRPAGTAPTEAAGVSPTRPDSLTAPAQAQPSTARPSSGPSGAQPAGQ